MDRLPRRYSKIPLFCAVEQYRRGGQPLKRFKFYVRIDKTIPENQKNQVSVVADT